MFGIKQIATRFLQFQSYLPSMFRFAHNSSVDSTMNPDVQRIHEFWFTGSPMKWFYPPDGLDQKCEKEFGPLVVEARANELDNWATEPKGTLALLVLLDQFPRNIYRGSPEAFSSDAKALGIASKAIAKGWDKEVHFSHATVFYLPFCHDESLVSNVASVALYENLMKRASEAVEEQELAKNGFKSAVAHRDIIFKFGRYPGRNKALGRQNTEEEEAFLKEFPSGLPL